MVNEYLPIEYFQDTDHDYSSKRIRDMPYGKRRESLAIFPTELTFTPTDLNVSSPVHTVLLANDGYDVVTIYRIDIVGDFQLASLVPPLTTIPAGNIVSLQVTFKPRREGLITGGIYLDTGDAAGPEFIKLIGFGQGEDEPYTGVVNPRDFGAKGDYFVNKTDDYLAIQAAFDTGLPVDFTDGDYGVSHPLLLKTSGQIITFRNQGYADSVNRVDEYSARARIVAFDTAPKRIMTRRFMRPTSAYANDPPMSAVIDIEAGGVQIHNPVIWLDTDYADKNYTNMGANWDIGIFIGCRMGVKLFRPQVWGYFRKAGILLDVTRDPFRLPELPYYGEVTGVSTLPHDGTAGCDGCEFWSPYIVGARVAFGVVGAIHAVDNKNLPGYVPPPTKYYDWVSRTEVDDNRGGSGASDTMIFDPRLYPGNHISDRRLADPTGLDSKGNLTWTGMVAEPDYSPAGLWIDGWAGTSSNTTHKIGAIRGMAIYGGRIVSPEIFRIRLGRCDEIYFEGRVHIEGGNVSMKTAITNVDVVTNDYVKSTYDNICADPVNTGYIDIRNSGGSTFKWLTIGKYTSFARNGDHRFKALYIERDGTSAPGYQKGLLDIRNRGPANEMPNISMYGFRPKIRFIDRSTDTNDFDIVVDQDSFDIRYGTIAPHIVLSLSNTYPATVTLSAIDIANYHDDDLITIAGADAAHAAANGQWVISSVGTPPNTYTLGNEELGWVDLRSATSAQITGVSSKLSASNNLALPFSALKIFTNSQTMVPGHETWDWGSFSTQWARGFFQELRLGVGGTIEWKTGVGAPNFSAPVGSLYTRTDGGPNTTLYVKESGTGVAGWVAK